MKPKYNVYQVVHRSSQNRLAEETHEFVFLKSCATLESAEHWLKGNGDKWTYYSILPEYYWTGFED